MQNLLLLFARVGNLLLFLFLEIICIFLIVNYNKQQREIFINSTNIFTSNVYKRFDNLSEFFQLRKTNEHLAEENSKLLEELINLKTSLTPFEVEDSLGQFALVSARVINNSVVLKNNKITINKGEIHGLKKGMGVIDENGLVGIIDQTSKRYSTAISLLNLQSNISVKIKKNNEIGELKWNGRSVRKMEMVSVPPHVVVSEGDSIITSGFSTVFPEGLFVGTVTKSSLDPRNGFQSLEVELSNKLSNLSYVYVIQNRIAEEQLNLEKDE